jgi:hypothetical protein
MLAPSVRADRRGLFMRCYNAAMNTIPDSLLGNTDAELIALIRELALQIDRIGREQARRIALAAREDESAREAEVNEGGSCPPDLVL